MFVFQINSFKICMVMVPNWNLFSILEIILLIQDNKPLPYLVKTTTFKKVFFNKTLLFELILEILCVDENDVK